MPSRKASCSVVGTGRGIPPSSPMVSSANNPNKSEIPDRRKDSTVNTVSAGRAPGGGAVDRFALTTLSKVQAVLVTALLLPILTL